MIDFIWHAFFLLSMKHSFQWSMKVNYFYSSWTWTIYNHLYKIEYFNYSSTMIYKQISHNWIELYYMILLHILKTSIDKNFLSQLKIKYIFNFIKVIISLIFQKRKLISNISISSRSKSLLISMFINSSSRLWLNILFIELILNQKMIDEWWKMKWLIVIIL